MIIDSLRGDESVKPISPIKTCDKGKVLGSQENFADEDKSDVNSGDSLAEIEIKAACTSSLRPRSSEEEERGESRLNLAPPKLEAQGDEWQCGVCRVIVRGRPKPISNDAGIPKCMACDLKTQSFVQAGVAPPAGVVASIGVSAAPGNSSTAAPQNLSTGTQFTCFTRTKVQIVTQKAAQSRRCWQGCSDVGRSRGAGGLGGCSSAKFEHALEQL